ncbi:MAG: glycerate kinase [Bacilli bacterium]|nr:glycerate kinase [Bacilli bacterium]
MNIVILPDSFKGSIDSKDIGEYLTALFSASLPNATVRAFPVSDGGEGFLDMVEATNGGHRISFPIFNATMSKNIDGVLLLKDDQAYIESAVACGHHQIEDGANALNSSSFALGQCINKSIECGAKRISIGLGGVITHDLGCGALACLGAHFYDKENIEFIPNGGSLIRVYSIRFPKLKDDVIFTIYSDVKNVLFGPRGAAHVFAKQKGVSDRNIDILEQGSIHIADLFSRILKRDFSNVPGSGAAGGLGFMAAGCLNAQILSGADFAISSPTVSKALLEADIIVTGEGRIDDQSHDGKIVGCLSDFSLRHSKRLIAIGGCIEKHPEAILPGVSDFVDLSKLEGSDYSMAHPKEALSRALRPLLDNLAGDGSH